MNQKKGDIMNGINEAFEKIIEHKAKLIRNNPGYEKYIKDVLKKHGIRDSKETVKAFVKVFKMGAVDAMIYDIAAASNLTRWKSQEKRMRMLMNLFAK
jgi:hypothetical protein